ncbi:hypothetical protein HPP92_015465 [Vanilla planifolia]|uniref:Pre-mRNA polyadenylation factor Fip1 domain-containing protein n=1 Tax=Vanilla planifolia TaxID=51239 RepID=A0A835UU26_VANPL|nr:hypothetical protein HPP92_015465 [Vanilla planifolia]
MPCALISTTSESFSDLEVQAIAGVPAVAEEDRNKSESEENEAQRAHGTVESGSSSDSDDDIQIVLNDEDSPNKLSQLSGDDVDDEEDDGDDLVILSGTGCSSKKRRSAEYGLSVDGYLPRSGERKGARRIGGASAIRAWDILSGRANWHQLTKSGTFCNGSYGLAFPVAFSNGCDFYLPQNRSIFDIDVESFECKPWRFNGVDITEYFNFGLDEEGWKNYCKQLVLFQQNTFPMCEPSMLNKFSQTISSDVAYCGGENGLFSIPDDLDVKRNSIRLPKGRAIEVESGNGERIPSIEVRRSRNRDSDVVIQITTEAALGDTSDPSMNIINHAVQDVTKIQSLSSSNNELFRSSKFSDHGAHSEASKGGVCMEEVPGPGCVPVSSGSCLQEVFFSDCYFSSEAASETTINSLQCWGMNSSSEDGNASPRAREHQNGTCATNFRNRDNNEHETHCGEISVMVRNFCGKELHSSFLNHQEKGHGQDLLLVGKRKERSSTTDVKKRKHCHDRAERVKYSRKTMSVVRSDNFQSSSEKFHYNTRDLSTWQRTVDEQNTRMKGHHDSMVINSRHSERSLDESFGRSVSFLYKDEESFMHKHDRFPCNSGKFYRLQQLDNYGKTLLFGTERSYVEDSEVLRSHEDGLHHPRSFEDTHYAEEQDGENHTFMRSQLHHICKSENYMGHSKFSHSRERISSPRSNHDIVSSKECCYFPSRTCSNCDNKHFSVKVSGLSPSNDAYSRRRKRCLAFPEVFDIVDVKFRNQYRKFSSTGRYTDHGTLKHRSNQGHTHSINGDKFYDKYWSISDSKDRVSPFRQQSCNLFTDRYTGYDMLQHQNNGVHKHSLRVDKFYDNYLSDTDSMDLVGSLHDNFVKDRCELAERVTRCKINRSNSIHVGNESDLIKETRDSKHKQDSSHFSVEVIGTCRSNKDIIAKCSNTYSISKEAEMEDFEEGQLIEEPDAQETAVKINFNPDGRSSASSPNAATSLHPLLNNKMNLDYPLQSNNLVGNRQEPFARNLGKDGKAPTTLQRSNSTKEGIRNFHCHAT